MSLQHLLDGFSRRKLAQDELHRDATASDHRLTIMTAGSDSISSIDIASSRAIAAEQGAREGRMSAQICIRPPNENGRQT